MTTMTRQSHIGFIGAGSVGKTLAVAMSQQGYRVRAVASRTFASAKELADLVPGCVAYQDINQAAAAADLIFITSSDDAIGLIASSVTWREGQVVAHCSGVTSVDVLEPARVQGAQLGGFHPLQTFSSVEAAVRDLPGSTFAIEGDEEVQQFLKEMALALGGHPIVLQSEAKPLYHATVVMLGGILNTFAGAVAEQWRHFGIERNQALKSLAPIMQGTAATLGTIGLPEAAAGPHIRGDVGTIRKHVDAIRTYAPELLPAYCQMLLAGLHIAMEKGVASEENGAKIKEILLEASQVSAK